MKLSIIIPMYNAEKYIADCLDSILKSDLPKGEYEVIIVNDGSKDKGPEIAQVYVSKHENFRYQTQENQGQSVARNYGIQEAQGEYLWFVDSDDKVDSNIAEILNKIEDLGNPDIFSFYLRYITEDGQLLTKAFQYPGEYNKIISGREAVLNGYQPSSVCVFFMKRTYVEAQNLRFYPGIYHQDSEFSYRMMAFAKTVYFSEFVPYIYIKHENTVVTATSIEKIIKKDIDDITIIKSYLKLSEAFKNSDPTLCKTIRKHCDGMVFGLVYTIYKKKKEIFFKERNKIILEKLIENGFYPMKIQLHPIRRNLFKIPLNFKLLLM